jgi:hypothetical protein
LREGRVGSIVVLLFLSILIACTGVSIKAEEEYRVIASLQAPTLTVRGEFGSDLALFEDILLIAERYADEVDIERVGRAYIFDSDWHLVTTLQDPDPEEVELFGTSVDIKSDMIALSRRQYVAENQRVGNIYLFNFEGAILNTIWQSELEPWTRFGSIVCFYGDLLLVSEIMKDDQGVLDSGVVHVFDPEGDLLQTIHSPSPRAKGAFGESIDASNEFILIAESGNRFYPPIEDGIVYVYNSEYELVQTLHSPDNQERTYFGIIVAISGDHIVVSEHWASVGGHEKAGRAHIYDTDWNLVATLESPTPEDNGEFGNHVAIGGGLVVVGERQGDVEIMNEGKAYVFDLEGNLIDALVSPEPEVGAQFGFRVVTDGDVIGVSEFWCSVDGVSKAGKVHVFQAGAADFTLSGLTINPSSVNVGGTVTISVECSNEGSISGSHTVTLMIDGEVEDDKTVTVAPNESMTISFDAPTSEKGTYSVEIEGLTGSYEVKGGIPGFPVESLVIGLAVVILVLWARQRTN